MIVICYIYFMKNFFKHLHTINKHRRLVRKHCFKCGLYWRGLTHDLSKYSPVEFFNGVKYFQGYRSPTIKEREENGYSKAWLHHKGRNKHHFEYWVDIDIHTKKYSPVKMPEEYLIEMFCDRIAASKVYLKDKYTDNSPLEYFLNKDKETELHIETKKELLFLLEMLASKGEKETFKYIKKHYKDKTLFK